MNPRSAIRSTSLFHVDPQIKTALDEELKAEQHEMSEEMRALQQIASLESHPGWKIIREQFLEDIEEYRSGRKLAELLRDYTLTDAQIGQATRNMNLVADELTRVLNAVTLAVDEVEKQKEEQRNETRQNMARRA